MISLYETYKEILLEATSNSRIITAIQRHAIIRFYYKGDKTEMRGLRTGEIYAFGESKSGNRVIRVYQTGGTTSTKIPDWKLFRVDKISKFEHVGNYDKPQAKFNHNGDNSMQVVFNIVDF